VLANHILLLQIAFMAVTGPGLGASHNPEWTGILVCLIRRALIPGLS
jgi:hypothetical protein